MKKFCPTCNETHKAVETLDNTIICDVCKTVIKSFVPYKDAPMHVGEPTFEGLTIPEWIKKETEAAKEIGRKIDSLEERYPNGIPGIMVKDPKTGEWFNTGY
jgi:hypothetical protein